MVMAMLVVLVGVMMSLLLVPLAVNQVHATQTQDRHNTELGAAETGLDVAVGQIRSAADGSGTGDISALPCGPMTGSVSAGGTARYQVTIDYLPADPKGQTDEWIEDNRLDCASGAGTSTAPTHALLRAQGTNAATGAFGTVPSRKLEATYIFHTDNRLVSGGQIHVYPTPGGLDLCMDAGSTDPASGTSLLMKRCDPSSLTQRFTYNPNLTISLVASKTAADPLGMCLDAGTPHANNSLVKFQKCETTAPKLTQQQWSFNGNANLQGTSDGKTLDKYCLNLQSPNVDGSFVILLDGTGCKQGYNNTQTFQPDAAAGAGAAGIDETVPGKPVGQLVNFEQFGRCLDVTNQNAAYAFMIAWPCKQAPDKANLDWNQTWELPPAEVPGRITTKNGSTTYCLESPGSTAPGQYVKLTSTCPGNNPPTSVKWRVFGKTDRYDTSYRIMDESGFCLSVTDPTAKPPDFFQSGLGISKIVVAKCDSSRLQKWNASPDLLDTTPLANVLEK
jgi:hypothetical protein